MRISDLGPFFDLQDRSDPGEWRPLADLHDGQVLDERVEYVADFLNKLANSEVDTRVCASTMSLGLFARLVSPLLGGAVLGQHLPRLTRTETFWQPTVGGPWLLALTGSPTKPDPGLAIREILNPLAETISTRYSVSIKVLRGNIASGVFGAIRMISQQRPDLTEPAQEIGRVLLADQLLDTGALAPEFRRTSCCLYYRIPGGGYCGDCVLTTASQPGPVLNS